MQYCVMVKGPCRGRMCDFWARVRIRKTPVDELVKGLLSTVGQTDEVAGASLEDAVTRYWQSLGLKDMVRLQEEDPGLGAKISEVEQRVRQVLSMQGASP